MYWPCQLPDVPYLHFPIAIGSCHISAMKGILEVNLPENYQNMSTITQLLSHGVENFITLKVLN